MLSGFAFVSQANTVTGINPGRNFNVKGFGFFNAALAVTTTARILDNLTFTTTMRTRLLL